MAKVYYITSFPDKETREGIIGNIILREFKEKHIKDENFYIFSDFPEEIISDVNKLNKITDEMKEKLANSQEPMVVELPVEWLGTIKIIEQKKLLNPNAVLIVFNTCKGKNIYECKYSQKVAKENADEVWGRFKIFLHKIFK